MRCTSCGFENLEGMKFCNECGTPIKARCSQCGFDNPSRAKFCGECGVPLSPSAESRASTVPRPPITYTPVHLAERIRAEQATLLARRQSRHEQIQRIGMKPEAIGQLVGQAIKDERFYMIADPTRTERSVRLRLEGVLSGTGPRSEAAV